MCDLPQRCDLWALIILVRSLRDWVGAWIHTLQLFTSTAGKCVQLTQERPHEIMDIFLLLQ